MEELTPTKLEITPLTFEQFVTNIKNYIKDYPNSNHETFLEFINAKEFSKALRQACNNGDVYLVRELLSYLETQDGASSVKTLIEEKPLSGNTALHRAANLFNAEGKIAPNKKPTIFPILNLLLKYNPNKNLVEEIKNSIHSIMQYCSMNVFILANSKQKSIVLTSGVATCVVVIIHDPQTKLTLFSHFSDRSLEEAWKIQQEFLSIFQEKGIDIKSLHVYLAGGIKSHFSSQQAAEAVRNFWKSKNVKLINDQYLLSRDFTVINDTTFFTKVISKAQQLCEGNLKFLSLLSQLDISSTIAINNFIRDIINRDQGMLYDRRRLERYCEKKKSTASELTNEDKLYYYIEVAVEFSVKEFIKLKNICQGKYVDTHKLLMVQNIHSPLKDSEKRILVSFHDPEKSVLHLVGFDLHNNNLFISIDDCAQSMAEIFNQRYECEQEGTILPYLDLTKGHVPFDNSQHSRIFSPPQNPTDNRKSTVYPPTPY